MSWVRTTLALGLVVVTSLVAAPTSVAQGPGSPGLGDPYFPLAGNGGYEVDHYDLNLAYAPKKTRLRGVATIDATATQSLSAFDLDLVGLRVRAVTVGGAPAAFARTGNELQITPAAAIADGTRFTVTVTYGGRPRSTLEGSPGFGTGWVRTDDGAFTLGEPRGAPTWFPCNDHPSDKATFRVTVTVPRHRTAVSNGVLESVSRHRGGRTFVWSGPEPMATYLAVVAIGRFRLRHSQAGGVPSLVALDPRVKRLGKGPRWAIHRIPAILATYSSLFGSYPFSTSGAIVDYDRKFFFTALETQTRPIFPRPFPFYFTGAMAHELAHQWFGDAVSIERWSDIWLNEGFATWVEWYWDSHGRDALLRDFFESYYSVPNKAKNRFGLRGLWGPVVSPPPKQLFGAAVYFRGGMTLEALREMVGNTTFISILRDWVQQHKYGNGTTEQFIALAEAESGRSLAHFFDVWLRQPGRPTSWT
jgi:aminopeptidase N